VYHPFVHASITGPEHSRSGVPNVLDVLHTRSLVKSLVGASDDIFTFSRDIPTRS
jgi:hypothetical protein